MSKATKNFYVTTPIFYAANPPRVGQVYSCIAADAIARYRKMCQEQVFFLTGAVSRFDGLGGDESEKHTEDYGAVFQESWKALFIEYNQFVSSRGETQIPAAFKFLKILEEKGFIYQSAFDEEQHHWSKDDPFDQESDSLYFFRLSDLLGKLEDFYQDNPTFVVPQASRARIIGLSRQRLKDIWVYEGELGDTVEACRIKFSRWFGSLIAYLSGIGFGSDEEKYTTFWPAEVQLVGEYAITTQALYWPSILMAAGIEPPHHILVNRKLSFRLGKDDQDDPDLSAVLKALPEDVFRYVLLRKVQLEDDYLITLEEVQEIVNKELSQNIAGQVARVSKMIDNFFEGKIPEPGLANAADQELIRYCQETVKIYRESFASLRIAKGLDSVMELISVVNRYLMATEPWKMVRDATKRQKLGNILYNIAEAMRLICSLLYPILPSSSLRMLRQLGASDDPSKIDISSLNWGGLKPGTSIVSGEIVISPLSTRKIREKLEAGGELEGENPDGESFEPLAPEVTIQDFAKIDIRVAKIIEAERVAKSDKLIKLQVDLGFEQRQVIAGIGKEYDPSELAGKVVAVVANLKPAKLMGEVSNGMIVAASDEGRPSLVVFDRETKVGSRLA